MSLVYSKQQIVKKGFQVNPPLCPYPTIDPKQFLHLLHHNKIIFKIKKCQEIPFFSVRKCSQVKNNPSFSFNTRTINYLVKTNFQGVTFLGSISHLGRHNHIFFQGIYILYNYPPLGTTKLVIHYNNHYCFSGKMVKIPSLGP